MCLKWFAGPRSFVFHWRRSHSWQSSTRVWHPESLCCVAPSRQWLNLMVCIPQNCCATKSFTWYLIKVSPCRPSSPPLSWRGFWAQSSVLESRSERRCGELRRAKGGGSREGLHRWKCFFYPRDVICPNALRPLGAWSAAVIVLLPFGC